MGGTYVFVGHLRKVKRSPNEARKVSAIEPGLSLSATRDSSGEVEYGTYKLRQLDGFVLQGAGDRLSRRHVVSNENRIEHAEMIERCGKKIVQMRRECSGEGGMECLQGLNENEISGAS